MGTTAVRQPQYDAFISYAHGADSSIAIALQDGIDGIAKRWDAVGSLRVFRDDTSLSLGPLQLSIKRALVNSRFLILLASPDAAESPWVREELRTFLESHPPESVLVVLTAGELSWDPTLVRFREMVSLFSTSEGCSIFHVEPLYLDMRWAQKGQDMTLLNHNMMNAAASLASAISGVSKDQIESTYIRQQVRLHRNQRINLGFRGFVGFGVLPALLFLVGTAYSITSSAAGAPAWQGYLLLSVGFPLTGALGGLCCGVGWRGTIGLLAGFALLLPFYLVGSLCPYHGSAADVAALSVLTVAGYCCAGALGGLSTREVGWPAGGLAFAIAGALNAIFWPLFPYWRLTGADTKLASGPWLLSRVEIAANSALSIAGRILEDRLTSCLIPLIACAALGGLMFGIRLADVRIVLPRKPERRIVQSFRTFAKRPFFRLSLLVLVALAALGWALQRSSRAQIVFASGALDASGLRKKFGLDPDWNETWASAFELTLRARSAFEARGNCRASDRLSVLIWDWLDTFGRSPKLFYRDPAMHNDDWGGLPRIARAVKNHGKPEEIDRLMVLADETARTSGIAQLAIVAVVENSLGMNPRARELTRLAAEKLSNSTDVWSASLLAQALYKTGKQHAALQLLESILRRTSNESLRDIGPGSLAPGTGTALWETGLWETLPAGKRDLGTTTEEVLEAMCREGRLELVMTTLKELGNLTTVSHIEAHLAGAAARAGQFDAAFGIVDGLRRDSTTGWTDLNEVDALAEITSAALRSGNVAAQRKADEHLKVLEKRIRQQNKPNLKAGVSLCEALALAGDYPAALGVAHDLMEEPWAGYRLIGSILAGQGRSKEARLVLAEAWRSLHLHSVTSASRFVTPENYDSDLQNIGESLARLGDLYGARSVADDIGGDLNQLAVFVAIVRPPETNRQNQPD